LVLGVCRRVTHHWHDAEDAFQSTFLVLARKAGSIGKHDSLSSWLYKVAYRIALRARARAAQRYTQETLVPRPASVPASDAADWHELAEVLDEEINRLPEKYRVPFILCYLERKTYEQIAQELACPKGTVSIRLTRARERLRRWLVRRGVVLSVGALAGFAPDCARAAVPPSLALGTSKAGLLFQAGQTSMTGVLSPQTVQLAEGVLKAMFLTKLKVATMVLLAVGVLGAGAGLFTHSLLAVEEKAGQQQGAVQAAAGQQKDAARAATDQDKLQGTWKVVRQESGGQVEKADDTKVVIEGDKLRFMSDGQVQEATFKLKDTKKLKEIDFTGTDNGREYVRLGIYELQGESWKLCLAGVKEARPAEFASQAGANWPKLWELKKQK
jgi:RNA polymerase sigma factor (sigma-70 family)